MAGPGLSARAELGGLPACVGGWEYGPWSSTELLPCKLLEYEVVVELHARYYSDVRTRSEKGQCVSTCTPEGAEDWRGRGGPRSLSVSRVLLSSVIQGR